MKLTLIEKREEGTDVVTFIFKPESNFSWKAGQFLVYTLPHDNEDSRKDKRYFTISSAPFETNLSITTRFAEKNGSSFKNALSNLQIGSQIDAEGPDGEFTVENPNMDCVFVSGGIGITAFRSILKDLDQRGLPINVLLLYANRDNNFIFKNEMEELAQKHSNFKINYFVEPNRITEEAIRLLVQDLQKPIFYISGPEPMVEAFKKMFAGMGIKDENIKCDYFPGYDWP